jgi:hypothetical protein
MIALPVIVLLQPVDKYVPITEYVPGVVNAPKLSAEVVPLRAVPTGEPLVNW